METKTRSKVAGDFYRHPYGGIGRDIRVTKEGMARFFGVPDTWFDDVPVNQKIMDNQYDNCEVQGWKIDLNGKISYFIVFIQNMVFDPWRFPFGESCPVLSMT